MTKITVFLIFLVVLVVGYYSYLSGKSRTEQQEAIMSEVDTALSRDLTNNYPATPKEVIKYYNDLIKCFYNEDCTTEELRNWAGNPFSCSMRNSGQITKKIPI